MYQVVWMRQLTLFFGNDIYAASITLSIFMGGLSLGSILAAKVSDHISIPLLVYAALEICIGFYALGFSKILNAFEPVYRTIYQNYFIIAPFLYHGFRILIASCTLLIPTILMGATLPIIVRTFIQKDEELGAVVGMFYSVNTVGALIGTVLVGFLFIPFLGITYTICGAVLINVSVGLLACLLHRLVGSVETSVSQNVIRTRESSNISKTVLRVIFVSGLAALALEVVWFRILVQTFSATAYSFTIMLASFLLGITLGSRAISRTIDEEPDPSGYLAEIELWLGASVVFLVFATYFVPEIFGSLVWRLVGLLGGSFGVGSSVAKLIVSTPLIMIPTFLLGASFPAAVKACSKGKESVGWITGRVYGYNTAGAIIGALVGGFIFIPLFGTSKSLTVIAVLFLCNGWYLARKTSRRDLISIRAVLSLTSVFLIVSLFLPQKLILNYNLQNMDAPHVIYNRDGIGHNVSVVRRANGVTIMAIGGNVEADTSLTQCRHFILKGHLPLLLHENPKEVAVIGLGLGITLSATARHPSVQKVQVIELSPEMVDAHNHLKELTGDILNNLKISLLIDDGRNFLSMTTKKFDMITADPIHPRISGVGYLYTQEYYRKIKACLRQGGVVCQWMPMYHISPESFNVAFRTFASVFEHAYFWYVRGHGLFVATTGGPIDYQQFSQRFATPAVSGDMATINMENGEQLLSYMLMGPKDIQAYLEKSKSEIINTDDNAYLEYFTPFEYLGNTKPIIAKLLPFARLDLSLIKNIPKEKKEQIRRYWEIRQKEILPELDMPLL